MALNKVSLLMAGVLVALALATQCYGAEVKKNYDLDENHFEDKRGELFNEAKKSVNREEVAKRAFRRLITMKRSGSNQVDRANFNRNIQYNMDDDDSDSDEFFSAERYEDDSDSSSDSSSSSSSVDDDDDDDSDSFEYKRKRTSFKRKRGGYRLWKHQSASNNLKKKH